MLEFSVHPGEILKEEIELLDMSISRAAKQLDVPPNRLSQILRGQRAITSDTALRLEKWMGVNADYWLRLQCRHELFEARKQMQSTLKKVQSLPKQPEAA